MHQRDAIARAQRQLIGQPAADRHAFGIVEALKRALLDPIADGGKPGEVVAAHAAHQHAGGIERRRGERLPLDHRRHQHHAGDLGDAVGDLLPVGERRFQRLDQQVAVEPEDLVEQFLAETVHHRHHDDERRHAQDDAQEREAGDDRNESFLAPRSQVAQRQHPFKGGESACPGRFGHGCHPAPRCHMILADSRHPRCGKSVQSAQIMTLASSAARPHRPGSSAPGCRRNGA